MSGRAVKRGCRGVGALAGLALAAMMVSAMGCATADVDSDAEVDGEEVGEVEQAIWDTGLFACTMADGTIQAQLVAQASGICFRQQARTPGVSYKYCVAGVCPSCYKLGKDLGCASIQ
ncbi:MAG: hypothetical protein R3B70_07340 [Polyangiaceae bacterium]